VKSSRSIKDQLLVPVLERPDVCQYVADMALELRSLCKEHDAKYLAYLLEIVFIEANEEVNRQRMAELPSADK
jgi:hypothetical protein